jgi:threonine/homoserine/homoserine lactone efflux protein
MPGLEYLLPFLLTALLLAITPGPGLLYIAAQSIGRGQKAGWFSAIGTHFASYVHIVAAAFGLSLFLVAVPTAYLVLKIVGATYLFWLGIRFLMTEEQDAEQSLKSQPHSHIRALKESLIVELTNPKSAVFFIAFLPQFSDQSAPYPIWLQIILLGIIANVIFTLAEISCVIFADKVSSFLKKSRSAGRWMRRAAGSVLIALGANLLLSER